MDIQPTDSYRKRKILLQEDTEVFLRYDNTVKLQVHFWETEYTGPEKRFLKNALASLDFQCIVTFLLVNMLLRYYSISEMIAYSVLD